MNKKEWEVRVMQHFAENMNLPQCMEAAKACAKEILDMKFEDIALGNYEMPATTEFRERAAEKIPYEFDANDFINNGPLDFSGLDDNALSEALKMVESLYDKFRNAQANVVARTAGNYLDQLSDNIKSEISEIRKKYLG